MADAFRHRATGRLTHHLPLRPDTHHEYDRLYLAAEFEAVRRDAARYGTIRRLELMVNRDAGTEMARLALERRRLVAMAMSATEYDEIIDAATSEGF